MTASRNKNVISSETDMYCGIRYETYLNTIFYDWKLLNCSQYINSVPAEWIHFFFKYSMLCT